VGARALLGRRPEIGSRMINARSETAPRSPPSVAPSAAAGASYRPTASTSGSASPAASSRTTST
jgi:hypothetical protein